MKTYLLIFTFFILVWQGLTISNTLSQRLEQRTEHIQKILQDI